MVKEHNAGAARAWGHSGAGYDFISFGLSDSLSHAVQKLWPRNDEYILDLATGTGWTARLVAMQGARVTGVDIADGLLKAAEKLSAHLPIEFRHADAEELPFPDETFDGVISTYGVIFAGQPVDAAMEMARVTRPGGRMVLTTWQDEPADYIPAFFALVGKYSGAPAPENSPMLWGDAEWLHRTFDGLFEIEVAEHPTTLFAPDADSLWRKYLHGFGPMQLAADALTPDALDAFRQEFKALHEPYRDGDGLRIQRKALLVHGTRI